jgi:4-hydroxy-tetrahydrodipicolinate synthase
MATTLKGTGVAVVTPFRKGGSIDFKALGQVINHTIDGGVEFLLALGTTSEAPTLSGDEKSAVIHFFTETVENRVPIMLGVGGNNTQEIINTLKRMDLEGIDSILTVAPYYNKPGQNGLFQHFKAIASASPLPVYLYNVPSRTSSNISAATTLKLASEVENIVGIKEASGDLMQIMTILRDRPNGFALLSGDDAMTLPLLSAGAEGVVSVVANAYPREFSDMVRYGLKGDFKRAGELHYGLLEIIEFLFKDGSPGGIKAVLEKMGLCENVLRLPLVRVSKKIQNHLEMLVETHGGKK